MGQSWIARCRACGRESRVSTGDGMAFRLLHCAACGRERELPRDYPGLPQGASTGSVPGCACGGRFSAEAPPRCPECRSADLEALPGTLLDYD